MPEPFEGTKVLDFSWVGAGPLVTKYLADFGATVVRVESSAHPDSLRLTSPFKGRVPGINRSGYFALFNGNKYSMALNLKHADAKRVLRRLVGWADIVCENFAPGVMERVGLGYEDLRGINPSVILFRTSTQGQTGPNAGHPGFGYQAAGFVGFPLLTGWPDRSPVPIPVAYTDWIGFHFGAAALIAALEHRNRTGVGQCIDVSQIEAALHFLSPVILDYEVNGRAPDRRGNASPETAPHGVFKCRGDDRWCAIAVCSDQQWQKLKALMGKPAWADDSELSTSAGRKRDEDRLNAKLEAWTVNYRPEDLMEMLQTAGVPCSLVADGETLLADEHLRSRGYFWETEHAEMEKALVLGQPFKLSKTPAKLRSAPPCLGEHTELVCKDILDISDEEFVELLNSGCFE